MLYLTAIIFARSYIGGLSRVVKTHAVFLSMHRNVSRFEIELHRRRLGRVQFSESAAFDYFTSCVVFVINKNDYERNSVHANEKRKRKLL